MATEHRVGIALCGAGFLARTRVRCYRQIRGVDAEIVGVAARRPESARAFAAEHGIAAHTTDVGELLARDDVDLVDLCVPNDLHRPLTEAAAGAGVHVACTKPLTAYVGQDLGSGASDADVAARDRAEMLSVATADAEAMVSACEAGAVQLMYGENWVYAPSMQRAARLLEASQGTVLDMRGGESHKGSHSPYSKVWRHTGGGALLRLGAHPIGAMLHLKRREGIARDGQPIRPVSVSAEVGDLSRIASLGRDPKEWVVTGWQDVENWGTVLITFSDGSRGNAWGADTLLGGMESRLEVSMSNCRLRINLSPNDMLEAYAPAASVFGDEYIMEKIDSGAGWTTPMPDEDWTSGHLAMCQDFVSALAEERPAVSDGHLGLDVVRVVYAAYLAAAKGRRVEL